MSVSRRGMGQGLDALFRNMPSVPVERPGRTVASSGDTTPPETWAAQPVSLPIAALTPGQGQPRKHFDETALNELGCLHPQSGGHSAHSGSAVSYGNHDHL